VRDNDPRRMQELHLATPRFRLRTLLLALAAMFMTVVTSVSAIDGCANGGAQQAVTPPPAATEWPEGFVELDPSASPSAALPVSSAR
jgi:hypothetical protein